MQRLKHIVIMAAGSGLRLEDKTESLPKTLLPLNGQPILSYILSGWKFHSGLEFLFVGGFCMEKLEAYLKDHFPQARLIFNPEYKKGNLKSFLCARPFISGSVCLANSDHIYPRQILEKIVSAPLENITAVCDFDRTLVADDMKMLKGADGNLREMDKKFPKWDGGYIGMTLIPAQKLSSYWEMASAVLEKYGENVHVETVLNELVKGGEPVKILDASGYSWIEVDTEEDLLRASRKIHLITPP